MNCRFEFRVPAECQQFLLQDEMNNNFPDWTREAGERLLAVEAGIIAVGTVSDWIVPVLLEIIDDKPEQDIDQ
jgi:hypothetical protein